MEILSQSASVENDLLFLREILTTKWRTAYSERESLRTILLQLAGFQSMEAFLDSVGPQTTVVTIVGGAASRWDASFDDPKGSELAKQYGIDRSKSRFLAPVPNFLPGNTDRPLIPILAYNLHGVRDLLVGKEEKPLAKHVLIYGKDEEVDEIRSITDKAGITQTQLCKQEIHPGKVKPFGHADALMQHLEKVTSTSFVVTSFGGDVTSAQTVELSLLCLYVCTKLGEPLDVILPTALMDTPKYPVFIDETGLPRQFGQEKLLGKDSLQADTPALSQGGSNIGIRLYTAKALRSTLEKLSIMYKGAEEFALDHVDLCLADLGRIRQLCIALPEEISHAAKTLTEIPSFLENEKKILSEEEKATILR